MTRRYGGFPGSMAESLRTHSRIRRASAVPSRRRTGFCDSTKSKNKLLRGNPDIPAQLLQQATCRMIEVQLVRRMRAALCASLMLQAGAVLGQSDFGMTRLAAGKEAFNQKRFAEAVEEFRVAGFALLDEPPRLLESLVRQAVAQSAGGHAVQDRKATIDRFLEVERRFPIFPDLDLEPEIRRTFQTILSRDVPAESLASLPELQIAS